MEFFSLKEKCSICGKEIGLNRKRKKNCSKQRPGLHWTVPRRTDKEIKDPP